MELLANLGMVGALIYYIPLFVYCKKAFGNWVNDYKGAIFPIAIIGMQLINDFASVSYFSMSTQAFLAMAIGLCISQPKQKNI